MRVGPISGNFTATVALSELNPPHSYKMAIEGSGNLGFANGVSTVTLTPAADGGTDLHVDTDGQVGGAVARVGQRMMGSVAKGMMDPVLRLPGRIGLASEAGFAGCSGFPGLWAANLANPYHPVNPASDS